MSTLIFGEPKVGKTSLTLTLPVESDSRVLYVAADPGQLALRKREFPIAEPGDGRRTRAFFDEVYEHLVKDGDKYDWVVVDGVDDIADAILADSLTKQKDARRAYGEMADYTETWMKNIRDLSGMSTIFITHIRTLTEEGEQVRYVPLFPGRQIMDKVNGWFDLIGCMRFVKNETGRVERVIQFSPEADTRFMVGDRSGCLAPYEPPDLGVVFKKIHEAGFVTKGDWTPPPVLVSEEDVLSLISHGKSINMAPIDILAMSEKVFGKNPRLLNKNQLGMLLEKMNGIV